MGIAVASPFFTWFLGACVPALVSLAVTPLIILRIMPPERKSTPEAPVEAKRRLEGMGPMAPKERLMASVMGATLVLWVAGDGVGISPTCAAMLGLRCVMLTLGKGMPHDAGRTQAL